MDLKKLLGIGFIAWALWPQQTFLDQEEIDDEIEEEENTLIDE